jgi:recombination protein RecR
MVSQSEKIVELIVATNPSLEGEATASYIQDIFNILVKEGKIHISRLAMGLPTGADLEYADRLTLKRALEGRRDI